MSGNPGANGPRDEGKLLLALDTSARDGSVAIGSWEEDGTLSVLAEVFIRAKEEHAAVLVPRIEELFRITERAPEDLSGIVVGAGPGSFTGVRVGAATAKGMAWALGTEFWALSSLLGAGMAASVEPLRPRMILFDARGDRLYAAAYRESREGVETLMDPTATTLGDVLDGMIPPGAVLMGDGARRHRDVLESEGNPVMPDPVGRPSARGLLKGLALSPAIEPVEDVGGWNPDYLRVSGAERLWKVPKA